MSTKLSQATVHFPKPFIQCNVEFLHKLDIIFIEKMHDIMFTVLSNFVCVLGGGGCVVVCAYVCPCVCVMVDQQKGGGPGLKM